MVWLKACPRCHQGDLHLEADIYGKYLQCLQCAYIQELAPVPAPAKVPAKGAPRRSTRRQPVAA